MENSNMEPAGDQHAEADTSVQAHHEDTRQHELPKQSDQHSSQHDEQHQDEEEEELPLEASSEYIAADQPYVPLLFPEEHQHPTQQKHEQIQQLPKPNPSPSFDNTQGFSSNVSHPYESTTAHYNARPGTAWTQPFHHAQGLSQAQPSVPTYPITPSPHSSPQKNIMHGWSHRLAELADRDALPQDVLAAALTATLSDPQTNAAAATAAAVTALMTNSPQFQPQQHTGMRPMTPVHIAWQPAVQPKQSPVREHIDARAWPAGAVSNDSTTPYGNHYAGSSPNHYPQQQIQQGQLGHGLGLPMHSNVWMSETGLANSPGASPNPHQPSVNPFSTKDARSSVVVPEQPPSRPEQWTSNPAAVHSTFAVEPVRQSLDQNFTRMRISANSNAINPEVDRLQAQVQLLDNNNQELLKKIADLTSQLEQSETARQKLAGTQHSAKDMVTEAEQRVRAREQQLQTAQQQVHVLENELAAVKAALAKEQAAHQDTKDEVVRWKGEQQHVAKELEETTRKMNLIGTEERKLQAELQQMRREYGVVSDALTKCKVDLSDMRDRLRSAEQDAARHNNHAVRAEQNSDGLFSQVSSLKAKVAELESRNVGLQDEIKALKLEISRGSGAPTGSRNSTMQSAGRQARASLREGLNYTSEEPPLPTSTSYRPSYETARPTSYAQGIGSGDNYYSSLGGGFNSTSTKPSLNDNSIHTSGGRPTADAYNLRSPTQTTAKDNTSYNRLPYDSSLRPYHSEAELVTAPTNALRNSYGDIYNQNTALRPPQAVEAGYARRNLSLMPEHDDTVPPASYNRWTANPEYDSNEHSASPRSGGMNANNKAWETHAGLAAERSIVDRGNMARNELETTLNRERSQGWDREAGRSVYPDPRWALNPTDQYTRSQLTSNNRAGNSLYSGTESNLNTSDTQRRDYSFLPNRAAAASTAAAMDNAVTSDYVGAGFDRAENDWVNQRDRDLSAGAAATKLGSSLAANNRQGYIRNTPAALNATNNQKAVGSLEQISQKATQGTAGLDVPYGTERTLKDLLARSQAMEDQLVGLCLQKAQLDAEYSKLPQHGLKTNKARNRKAEIEQRLEVVQQEISNLRLSLKKLHGR